MYRNDLSANLSSREKPLHETKANRGSGTSSYTIGEGRVAPGPGGVACMGGVIFPGRTGDAMAGGVTGAGGGTGAAATTGRAAATTGGAAATTGGAAADTGALADTEAVPGTDTADTPIETNGKVGGLCMLVLE